MVKWLFMGITIACIATIAKCVPVDVSIEYPRFIQLSYGDDILREVDLEAEINAELMQRVTKSEDSNTYLLYTRNNPRSAQILSYDRDSIIDSHFDRDAPTVITCHGWGSYPSSSMNIGVRDAYLEKGDANVIVVDWSEIASSNYVTAVALTPSVGRNLGRFLAFLHEVTGVLLESIHLTGYSLGAHVVGNAGRELNGTIARITGLDPAGPLWNLNPYSLKKTDAIYTEAIHTDGGILGQGIGSSVAMADFFPNGGTDQPGCSTSNCNHARSWQYFAATVTYNHLHGAECSNSLQIIADTCSGGLHPMGNDDVAKQLSGLFRVNTAAEYPYLLSA